MYKSVWDTIKLSNNRKPDGDILLPPPPLVKEDNKNEPKSSKR